MQRPSQPSPSPGHCQLPDTLNTSCPWLTRLACHCSCIVAMQPATWLRSCTVTGTRSRRVEWSTASTGLWRKPPGSSTWDTSSDSTDGKRDHFFVLQCYLFAHVNFNSIPCLNTFYPVYFKSYLCLHVG